ncbi:MAG: FAD-dependent monooxygenase, partial [Candidatus Tumulicola sp.]
MTTRSVAVIGAGLGGLTAALALIDKGFDVTVFEQSSELREVGAGVQLGPNAMRVYRALGLEQTIADFFVRSRSP